MVATKIRCRLVGVFVVRKALCFAEYERASRSSSARSFNAYLWHAGGIDVFGDYENISPQNNELQVGQLVAPVLEATSRKLFPFTTRPDDRPSFQSHLYLIRAFCAV